MNTYHFPYSAVQFNDQVDLTGRKVQCYQCEKKFIISPELINQVITSPNKSAKSNEAKQKPLPKKYYIIKYFSFFVVLILLMAIPFFIIKSNKTVSSTQQAFANQQVNDINMDPSLFKTLVDTYKFYDLIRSESGFYLDSYNVKSGLKDTRISSASTGIGLVSLAIAHELGIDSNAEDKVIKTLQSCLNKTPGIKLERNSNGLYRHWFNKDTGETMWNSEFSTIDTALLVAGATFCRNTFKDSPLIQALSQDLWSSINWESTRIDPYTFALIQSAKGENSGKTKIFNEYLLLADYVSYSEDEPYLEIDQKWTRSSYGKEAVLSDRKNSKLPLFTFQFPLYLSPNRISSEDFIKESLKAAEVDRDWWLKQSKQKHIWGSSAGTGLKGYSVDATEENHDMIAHLPAMFGFAPFNKEMAQQASTASKIYPEAIFKLNDIQIPWRVSINNRAWRPKAVQGIDLSPLLFGLASMHPDLGLEFFRDKSKLNYK
jgi:hypothetical protein